MISSLSIVGILVKAATGIVVNERRLSQERYRAAEEAALARARMEHERSLLTLQHREQRERRQLEFDAVRQFQAEMQRRENEWQWKIAEHRRETLLAAQEYRKILDNSPLRIYPTQILSSFERLRARSQPVPLLVLLSPPQVDFDAGSVPDSELPPIEKRLSEGMRRLFSNYESGVRPVQFIGGAWDSKRMQGETAAAALFLEIGSVPTLIVESELSGDLLNLRAYFWAPGQESYTYRPLISGLSWRGELREIARAHALRWEEDRARHLALGRSEAEAAALGEENERNLARMRAEETDRAAGIRDWERDYEFSDEHVAEFCDLLTRWHALLAGFVADAYHLAYHRVPPALPALLPSLLGPGGEGETTDAVLRVLMEGYAELYASLAPQLSHWMPQLHLDFARALLPLRDRDWARSQIEKAVASLGALSGPGADALTAVAQTFSHDELRNLQDLLAETGSQAAADRVAALLRQAEEQSLLRTRTGDSLDDTWG